MVCFKVFQVGFSTGVQQRNHSLLSVWCNLFQVLALYDICHKAQRGYEQTPGARSPGVLRNAAEHLAKTVKSLGDSAESHASHVQISVRKVV